MKTTVEVPDQLYRQIKATAALKGQTIKAFFLEALRDKLGMLKPESQSEETEEVGWRAIFGKGDPDAVADVQRIIDEEFSRIDYSAWDLPARDS
jgi:hypothetical protein